MSEQRFLEMLSRTIPGAGGYRDRVERGDTDARLREYAASTLETLRGKIADLKAAAEEEGEEDMLLDIERLDDRMQRTIATLRSAGHAGSPFFGKESLSDTALEKVCAYDQTLLEDVSLLATDIQSLKYETIGNLTLREVEGTLAAIELKVANRKDMLDDLGRA